MNDWIKAGLYQTLPEWAWDRFRFPCLHQSTAKLIVSQSAYHAWYDYFKAPQEPFDEAGNFGQVCHQVLLGGKKLVVVDAPDWRTKEARTLRDAALESQQLPVLMRRYEAAKALLEGVRGCVELSGQSEITAIWRKNGVWCQGTLDHVILPKKFSRKKRALIYDFKFTQAAATKKACENRCIEHGYDIQHAAYVEAIETIYPKLAGRVEMIFIFVEVEPPHAIRLMPLAGSMRTSGQWRWAEARAQWKQSLAQYGVEKPWPGYRDDGEPAECPAWALKQQIGEEQQRQYQEERNLAI